MWQGEVLEINVAAERGGVLSGVQEVRVVPGRGLEGDRNFSSADPPGGNSKRKVTLIESEALAALQRDYGIALSGAGSRRNILTKGVPLNHLVGKEFRIGPCVLRGTELCEPCGYLEKMTQRGVVKGLIHRGGLCAEIVEGGTLQTGARISPA
jgi:MOSC domain-containing protein YiiM